jgi:putative flippase GtrA
VGFSGLLLSSALLSLFINILDLIISKFLSIIFVVIIQFFLNKFITFKKECYE